MYDIVLLGKLVEAMTDNNILYQTELTAPLNVNPWINLYSNLFEDFVEIGYAMISHHITEKYGRDELYKFCYSRF